MKVTTIVGTRPELIRLSRVIPALDLNFSHTLVHTGQNYDYALNEVFFDELGLRSPDIFLDVAGGGSTETIARVIEKSDKALRECEPDAVLILGDTNSSLAAIAAKRLKIPIFHIEAGNRCFDMRVPEEINRRIVDHISDVNITYSSHARENLLREGMSADLTIKLGSPMKEVLDYYRGEIENSDVLDRLGLEQGNYFVFSSHREENVDSREGLLRIVDCLEAVASAYSLPIVFSVHPRTRKAISAFGIKFSALVRDYPPFGFLDYVKLQMSSRAVISDSGTRSEEASI